MKGVSERKPCPRCGVIRHVRKTSGVCRDCRDSLTVVERKEWAA